MADIAILKPISRVHPESDEVYTFLPNLAITQGQALALNSTGKAVLADANDTGDSGSPQQFKGIALEKAGTRQGVSILKRGVVAGYDLSGLAYGAKVYLSDNAGNIATALSATKTVVVGTVVPMSDSDLTKCLYVDADQGWAAGY